MAYDIGPKLGIDGEAEFRRAISNINTNIRTLGTEMAAVTSAYDANDRSVSALSAQNQVLTKQIEAQKDKLEKLREGLAESAGKYGENDEKTQRWQQTVNMATAELNKMERQLADNTSEMEQQGKASDGLKDKLGNLSSTLGSGLASAAKAAVAGAAAVTTAVAGMLGAVVKGVSSTAEYGDNIDKMSQKLGMSAEAYQEWAFIMEHCGASVDSMQSSMKTLATAAETGNAAFEKLGISQEDLAQMSQEDLFSATISALQSVSDETQRTYLAGQLLGRGATELGPLLNTSAADTEAMRQQVHALGGVMSNEAVAASAAFQDSLQNLKTGLSGLSRGALSDFLPSATQVLDGLTALVTGDSSGLALISQGVDGFAASLSAAAPRVMEAGGQIVTGLLGAITDNLPRLFALGTPVLMEFTSGIVGMLPELSAVALEVVSALSGGMADALPELIPAAVEAVMQIVETLTNPDSLGGLVDAALELILSLAEGLVKAIPELLKSIPVIVKNLVQTLVESAPKLLAAAAELIVILGAGLVEAIPELLGYAIKVPAAIIGGIVDGAKGIGEIGGNIVKGLWEGIKNMGAWLEKKVSDFFSGIVSSVKGLLGIHSPSTVFAGIGGYMAEGLSVGFSDEMRAVQRNVERSMADLADGASGTVELRSAAAGSEAVPSAYSQADLAAAIKAALNGAGVYLSGRKVGELVTDWQNNQSRANGADYVVVV